MSVTSVEEQYLDRPAEFSEGDDKGEILIAYKRVFRVYTSSVSDDGGTLKAYAKANSDLPWFWEEHDTDTNAIVNSWEAAPVDQTQWLVTVGYRKKKGFETTDSDPVPDDPTEAPPQISVSSGTRISRVADRGYDTDAAQGSGGSWTISSVSDARENPSVAIENSAGQPFDPALMLDESLLQIVVSRNEAHSAGLIGSVEAYKDTINLAAVTVAGVSIGPLEGKMVDIGMTKRWMEDGTKYFEVTYTIEVDRRGHVRQVLDTGYYTQESNGDYKKIVDKDGELISEPVKLDGSGGALAAGGSPVYLGYITSFPKSWSALNLPTTV